MNIGHFIQSTTIKQSLTNRIKRQPGLIQNRIDILAEITVIFKNQRMSYAIGFLNITQNFQMTHEAAPGTYRGEVSCIRWSNRREKYCFSIARFMSNSSELRLHFFAAVRSMRQIDNVYTIEIFR
ncbi:MAG: hypothetical protein BGO13_05245 [Burkholderiales bacterium 66-5]|nr:MAG: hypothetical protein BGO13_05245 [Burkholderiales bacterium 66-5]